MILKRETTVDLDLAAAQRIMTSSSTRTQVGKKKIITLLTITTTPKMITMKTITLEATIKILRNFIRAKSTTRKMS